MEIKDRKHLLRKVKNSFVGSDAVAWMMSSLKLDRREDCILLGQQLQSHGLIVNALSKGEKFDGKQNYWRFRKGSGDSSLSEEEMELPSSDDYSTVSEDEVSLGQFAGALAFSSPIILSWPVACCITTCRELARLLQSLVGVIQSRLGKTADARLCLVLTNHERRATREHHLPMYHGVDSRRASLRRC